MNIIFTGMRGTGKSTLGAALAQHIGWDFLDIDQEIERQTSKKITQIVEEEGWSVFRELEQQVAQECSRLNRTVIATGGGTMMNAKNASTLKKSGHVVLLLCDLKRLKQYLRESYERPSLKGERSAIEELENVWKERKDQYHAVADTIIETTTWPTVESMAETLAPFIPNS